MKIRKWIAWLAVAAGLLLLHGACAEAQELGLYDPFEREPVTVTWQEMNVPRDTMLPVYSAPFEDAWRGAGGKAAVNTTEGFSLVGTLQGETWGLVSYQVDDKSRRLGWIRMPEGASGKYQTGDMWINRMPLRVTRSVALTDDPRSGNRQIRTLEAGEQVIGMFLYAARGKVYVETRNEGKTVWGLIPADAVEDITQTFLAAEGDVMKIREGVTIIGSVSRMEYIPDEESSMEDWDYRDVAYVQPGDISIGMLDLYVANSQAVHQVELPHSLRWIGMEGISTGSLTELRFGGGLEISNDALYAVRIDRVVLSREYTGAIPDGQYVEVKRWDVEEGNPVYRDIDGVLFSADGKTLLRYPYARPDDHYDVPAGTEEIADYAFADNAMGIPLRSISLPLGLKRIGAYAFSGCGSLLSLAVPLTVKEVVPNAFANCVSLERLSLPPGMTAELSSWVKREDFSTGFRGDNWGTYPKPAEKEEWEQEYETFPSYPVWLDNAEGSGTVPVYASPAAQTSSGTEPAGSRQYVFDVQNGRANLGEDRWVDLNNTRNESEYVFFRITDAEPADPDKRYSEDGRRWQFYGIEQEAAGFSAVDNDSYEETTFPIRECLLYRERTGSGERMGIIVPEGDSAALLDAPGGAKQAHLYFGTQAKILEESEGWIRIETTYGTGWIRPDELTVVAEEP